MIYDLSIQNSHIFAQVLGYEVGMHSLKRNTLGVYLLMRRLVEKLPDSRL